MADTLRDILVERARAGVRVFVLYDAFGNQGIPDSDLVALRAAGAHVVPFRPLSFANLYVLQNRSHPKTFVVDGQWASIGTMNFDNRSLALNDEVTPMVHDSAFGARMDSVFVDDLRYANEISAVAFAKQPWTEHVGERAASLITRLL